MSLQRLFLFILVLAVGCRTVSAERSAPRTTEMLNQENPSTAANPITPPELNQNKTADIEQIEVNKNVLRTSADEQMRLTAANLLLFDPNSYARQVLIETLNLTNNSPARLAVCKALNQTRTTRREIRDKDDFIVPLLNIFSTKVDEEVRLASEAILIYNYKIIGPMLDQIVTDTTKPAKTRINIIQAFKKVWEKEAIIRLYRLLEDIDPEVAAEAGNAIRSLGFKIGTNKAEREKIISDIQNKEIIEVLKELLIKQDTQINQQKTDFESLRKFALTILDDAYVGIGVDDTSKGKFLNKYLADSQTWIKLWAVDKVRGMRMATQTSIPAELEPVIIKLISDSSKEIRLKTVELIGLMQTMQTVDLAPPLLTQFDAEQDDQVKNELLNVLGIVCSTTHSAESKTKIPLDTKQRVLGYASDFLSSNDTAKARIGARVMRKLLEKLDKESLQEQEIQKYLAQLSNRYNKQKEDPNNALISELLTTMVGLAADSSASREYARKNFSSFFAEALDNKNDLIRETAIDGLGYTNKASALSSLRDRIDKEQSERVRLKIIEFAKDVGSKDDLDWLARRLTLGTNSEPKQAWTAMTKIFGSVDIDVLNYWETQLVSGEGKHNLSELQLIDFLKIVLAKTPENNKPKYYEQIANRYFKTGQYEQAINYFNLLQTAAATEVKNRILPGYLDSCLRMPNENLAAKLIMEFLSGNDFNSDSAVISTIDRYFKDEKVITDKNVILKSLKGITLNKKIPGWQTKLKEWSDLINKTQPEKTATIKDTP
ncbi:MAG: HEAT repeat domain-containing protein [Sedimentisphaerales bacterium]|nr:HEAT repeat domain-containing protein [Sedimentisphaerales bacterium]